VLNRGLRDDGGVRLSMARCAGLMAVLLLLAGCTVQGGAPVPNPATGAGAAIAADQAEAARASPGGGLTVRPPQGYCIDDAATRDSDAGAVVLIGRCSDAGRVPPAVISVTAGPAGSARAMEAGGAALAAYLASDVGRSALSREGRAADLRVVQAMSLGDAVLLRLEERGTGSYWRAMLGLKGRLVTVSVSGAALSAEDGRRVLEEALTALRQANRAQAAAPASTGTQAR